MSTQLALATRDRGTRMTDSEPANPVHMSSGPSTRWTTVNFAEAIQGVQKPLGWAMWSLSMETPVRRAFGALGVLARREVRRRERRRRMSGSSSARRRATSRSPVGGGSHAGQLGRRDRGEAVRQGAGAGAGSRKSRSPRTGATRSSPSKMPRAAWRAAACCCPRCARDIHEWWERDVLRSPN